MNKKALLIFANLLSLFWRLTPRNFRLYLYTGLFIVESRGDKAKGLRQLLLLRDKLDLVINERATAYGNGIHPKHRLTNYHQFFIDRIHEGENVLDIGCGCGAVALSIAKALPTSNVTGIDLDKKKLAQANSGELPHNLSFVEGDATLNLPDGLWDVVVLSNVLEHIIDREDFLSTLKSSIDGRSFLIRVPLFERDWQMALRNELDVNYLSDPDHKIEHNISQFHSEINNAGLKIFEVQTLWGEIWADCRPIQKEIK